MCVFQSSQVN
uniref:Uncharacterized protein n=1 Tax=Anguilla anguilla TaxID=7936 RepID=A0A0E9W415_ANGAN